jgi:hypothetical protein
VPSSILLGLSFDAADPVIAWLCWVPDFVAAEWRLRRATVRPLQA